MNLPKNAYFFVLIVCVTPINTLSCCAAKNKLKSENGVAPQTAAEEFWQEYARLFQNIFTEEQWALEEQGNLVPIDDEIVKKADECITYFNAHKFSVASTDKSSLDNLQKMEVGLQSLSARIVVYKTTEAFRASGEKIAQNYIEKLDAQVKHVTAYKERTDTSLAAKLSAVNEVIQDICYTMPYAVSLDQENRVIELQSIHVQQQHKLMQQIIGQRVCQALAHEYVEIIYV